MKCDIVLAGVGGQGILTIAAVLGRAAMGQGLRIKQAEVHGMAQRGGAVQSHFRMASGPIASDVIPKGKADMILSLEPMEALRYAEWLKPDGWLITNSRPVENITVYPDVTTLESAIARFPSHIIFDGTALAAENGTPRALNMSMLGAASVFLELPVEVIRQAVIAQFAGKGQKVVDANLVIFDAAHAIAQERRKV